MTEGFAIIPNWLIRDTDVSVHALAVYAVLSSRADKTGVCWPSIPTIAKEARTSDGTAKKALQELADVGVLSWVTRKQGNKNLSNLYRLNMSMVPPEGVGQEMTHPGGDPGVGQEMTQGGSGDDREEEPLKKNQITRTTTPVVPAVDFDSLFEDAWAHWPKKTEKKLSRERFLRVIKKHPTLRNDVVLFGDAYAATTPTEFVPALAVWINRERWDEPLPEPRGGARSLSPAERALQTLALGQDDQKAVGA